MPIRIPKNQIQFKYTSGKEYVVESTYREYQGYYYELNGKKFAGKEFNSNALTLIPIPKNSTSTGLNSLLLQAATFVYGKASGTKLNNIKIPSLVKEDNPNLDTEGVETYYAKKINTDVIKQINKETYNSLKTNTIYITVIVKADYSNIDEANKVMPGVKDFILK